jgi:aminoglycoside 6'-N-acetyltransferase I
VKDSVKVAMPEPSVRRLHEEQNPVSKYVMIIRVPEDHDWPAWLAMRMSLWPGGSEEAHLAEMSTYGGSDPDFVTFLATDAKGTPCAFAEASLRRYADGCDTGPVGYLEGIYVSPTYRNRGIARDLVAAVERWSQFRGCVEMASDCLHDNTDSILFHRSLGFAVVETLIHFQRDIPPLPGERPTSMFS